MMMNLDFTYKGVTEMEYLINNTYKEVQEMKYLININDDET